MGGSSRSMSGSCADSEQGSMVATPRLQDSGTQHSAR